MNEESIRAVIREVLAKELSRAETPPAVSQTPPQATNGTSGAIPLEVSARHVHLTKQAVEQLFGPGAKLIKKRELSQPGEFLSEQRVRLITERGVLENVAVLGPERSAVQVELSLTDCKTLGVTAPVNLSGNLSGAGDITISGAKGCVFAAGSVIAARAHIHMPPEDAKNFGLKDGEHVSLRISSARPIVLGDVMVRVRENFKLACHIDVDEANAACVGCGSSAYIVGSGNPAPALCAAASQTPEGHCFDEKLVTEAMAVSVRKHGGCVRIRKGTIVTPAARDVFTSMQMKIEII